MTRRTSPWLVGLLGSTLGLLIGSGEARAQDFGEVWRVVEIPFTSSISYGNPYRDVDCTVTFTIGPTSIGREMFWDGGNTFRVRFAPTATGTWSYSTSCSDTANSGLHGKIGTVSVGSVGTSPYAYQKIYRQGHVKKVGNYLAYDNGEPFYWMSDAWAIPDKARLTTSNKAGFATQWQDSMKRRASQGFNVIQYSMQHDGTGCESNFPHGIEYWQKEADGVTCYLGKKINPALFQNHWDTLVKQVADEGLVSALAIGYSGAVDDWNNPAPYNVWSGYNSQNAAGMIRLARYMVARYGAYPVTWDIVEPDYNLTQLYIDRWRVVGQEINASDSYNRPIFVWYQRTAFGEFPTYYLSEGWVDGINYQGGHGDNYAPAVVDTNNHRWYAVNYPNHVVVGAGGYNYEEIRLGHNAQVERWSMWRLALSGLKGIGYGAQGTWNVVWDNSDTQDDFLGPHKNWYEAIDFTGSYHMKWIRRVMGQVPFHNLKQRTAGTGWNAWSVSQAETAMPTHASTDDGKFHVIYFPDSYDSGGTIYGLGGTYKDLMWIDPATGNNFYERRRFTASSHTIAGKPSGADWVLVVRPHFVEYDFNGDFIADRSVFRASEGNWYVYGQGSITYGGSADVPVAGDYDGDGKADHAVFRQSGYQWFIRSSAYGSSWRAQWGVSGDKVVPFDYDGNGTTDIAIWRPSDGNWYIRHLEADGTNYAYEYVQWGLNGDVPMTGDVDGDNVGDLIVYRPSEGRWYFKSKRAGQFGVLAWGISTDVPVTFDYNGDGKTDLAVYRAGTWYICYNFSLNNSWTPQNCSANYTVGWGLGTDKIVPADYNGDGTEDIAVWRPSDAIWWIYNQSSFAYGLSTDLAVPNERTGQSSP